MILDRLVGIFGLVFAAAIAARVYIVHRQIGKSPIVIQGGDSAHDFAHRVLAVIIVLEALNILLFRLQWYFPERTLYPYLVPFEVLRSRLVEGLGLALACAGLCLSVTAQAQLGRNWRIGNDVIGDTVLVRHGLYARSRHPIYAGFMAIAFGLFLTTPNVLTLFCAIGTPVILSIIARLEEEFQTSRHGGVYREYLLRTRRWL